MCSEVCHQSVVAQEQPGASSSYGTTPAFCAPNRVQSREFVLFPLYYHPLYSHVEILGNLTALAFRQAWQTRQDNRKLRPIVRFALDNNASIMGFNDFSYRC